jgi:hypothetical protein
LLPASCWFLVWLILRPLMMEATCSSERSADFQRTARRYVPENRALNNHRCEDLESYIYPMFLLCFFCTYVTPHKCSSVKTLLIRHWYVSTGSLVLKAKLWNAEQREPSSVTGRGVRQFHKKMQVVCISHETPGTS